MIEKFKGTKYIFFVGIGGSDLASKAVWRATTLHKPETSKKVFFLEAPDSREYEEVQNFVENEITKIGEVVVVVVSKSGETTETLDTFHKTFDILSEKFGEPISERVVVISTEGSSLWKFAETKNFEKIAWHGNVGGRFSAFTVAHTFFMNIADLNMVSFVKGGGEMEEENKKEGSQAKLLAQNIFENYKKDVKILDFFIFNSELEDLGKWCRQLIAESISILTPTVSIGPTDLHSMLELYLGGPKDRFTVFVKSSKEIRGSVNESAYENTILAYERESLPFEKYQMDEISEYNIGKFMGLMIGVTLELAKLLGVDPLDQPAVEAYKKSIHNS